MRPITPKILALIALSVFSLHLPSFGQFRNIKLDERPADERVCDPGIMINSDNAENIVVATAPNIIYRTKNSGLAWEKITVQSPFGFSGSPSLLADSKGNFYLLHPAGLAPGVDGQPSKKFDRLVVQQSSDEGATWTEGDFFALNADKGQNNQRLSIDNKDNLYVTWTQYDRYANGDADCTSSIFFSKSKNGKKWSDPVQISQVSGNCLDDENTTAGSMPVINTDTRVYVTWGAHGNIYFDRSYDGGGMWLSSDIQISKRGGGSLIKIPGQADNYAIPVLLLNNSKTSAKNSIYLLWADQSSGVDDTDIWFMRSNNGGDNWTSPLRVNKDEPGKHQYMPTIAVDQATGYMYVLYYDRRNYDDTSTDVYLAFSIDNGNNFYETKISDSPFVPAGSSYIGRFISLSAYNGVITPVWTRIENGNTSIMTAVIKHEELETATGVSSKIGLKKK
jgi:hypothetical protein